MRSFRKKRKANSHNLVAKIAIAPSTRLSSILMSRALAFHRRHEESAAHPRHIGSNQGPSGSMTLPLDFGHFRPISARTARVQIEPLPRHFLHEVNALHRHPRVPRRTGYQSRRSAGHSINGVRDPWVFFPASRVCQKARGRRRTHVSSTSGSRQVFACNKLAPAPMLHPWPIDFAIFVKTRPNSECPHQSLPRERHQGPDIFHPVEIGLLQLLGTISIAPDFTASIAG